MSVEASPPPLPLPRVCVDASLVLHLILPDERDEGIAALWQGWAATGVAELRHTCLYASLLPQERQARGELAFPA